jgi:hypothetical protein
MRNSAEHLPLILNRQSRRQSPVTVKKLRNPFDSLRTKGIIKPVCHKSRVVLNGKPPRLPNISPSPRFLRVSSEKELMTKANFFQGFNRTPNRKSSDCYKSPGFNNIFMDEQEITFGVEEIM